MQKKTPKCFSVSVIVFTNSVLNFWDRLKVQMCAENTIEIVVSATFKATKNDPKFSKFKSQKLVQA